MATHQNLPDAPPRIISINGDALGIKTFGADNGYPQRMLNLINACGTAKMCSNTYAKYVIGKGFENLDFYKAVIGWQNNEALTPDKLIRMHAPDKGKLRGIALHVNYNALYAIENVAYVPFENVRKGALENAGKFAVYDNWYSSEKGGGRRSKKDFDFIHAYNPDPNVIERQVNEAGGWQHYKGQILWKSDDFSSYPTATVDPVLDDVEAEIESRITRKNNLRNNFQLKYVWTEKGQLQDDETEEEVVETVRTFMGPEGKPVMVCFSKDPEGKDVPTLTPLESKIDDKLFQYTDQSSRLSIYTIYGQPAILHSDYLGANGYNEGQLPQSQQYYSDYTDPDRIFFEEVYREVFSRFHEPINVSDNYKLIPLTPLKTSKDGNTPVNT